MSFSGSGVISSGRIGFAIWVKPLIATFLTFGMSAAQRRRYPANMVMPSIAPYMNMDTMRASSSDNDPFIFINNSVIWV